MSAQLVIVQGPDAGRRIDLDRSVPKHLGRGSACEVVLTDPLASRFHAVIYFEDGDWHVRDTSSRNGTCVNGQKIDAARLTKTNQIVIGDTVMEIVSQDDELSSDLDFDDPDATQTVYLDQNESDQSEDGLAGLASVDQILDLYQLSLSLLRQEDANDVLETVLELIRDRTDSDYAGLSLLGEGGELRPRPFASVPADGGNPTEATRHTDASSTARLSNLRLSKSIANRILGESEAIWVRHNSADGKRHKSNSKIHKAVQQHGCSEAVLIPLQTESKPIGVMQLLRADSSFRPEQFDLAVSAGRLVAIGLARSNAGATLREDRRRLADQNAIGDEFIGECAGIQKLKSKIVRIGPASGCVLVRGESGSGKELVARALHQCSSRSDLPLLAVNCAAIPPNLIESHLFGHKKGAFTGAEQDHSGWFSQAHGGTLFLDEIGELPLEGQAKLLRVLEGHPFLPVGSTEEVIVDVRVIAATNRDLAEFVREKQFREDLFYRLSVFELVVPPLRERDEDIERLIRHFFDHFRRQHGRAHLELSKVALERLCEYPWPGNVRQLRNVIDSAVVMADDPEITEEDLGIRDAGLSRLETLRLDVWEERLIRKALSKCGGNVPEAAKLLGISRATAYRKITEYEIQR